MARLTSNPASFSDFDALTRESGWVRGLALCLLGDEALAEDLSQDVFVEAMNRPAGLAGPRLRAWLATVTRRLAQRTRHRERNRHYVEREAARPEAEGQSAGDRLELHRCLVDAVGQLHEPYRTAVVMRYLEGLAADEMARRLAISPVAARKRVSRGIELLRSRLDGEFEGGRQGWSAALVGVFVPAASTPITTSTPTSTATGTLGAGSVSSLSATGIATMVLSHKLIVLVALGVGLSSLYVLTRDRAGSAVSHGAGPAVAESPLLSPHQPHQPPRIAVVDVPAADRMVREALAGARPPGDPGQVHVVSRAGDPVPGARAAWVDGEGRVTPIALDASGMAGRPAGSAGAVFFASAPMFGPARSVGGVLADEVELVLSERMGFEGRVMEDGGVPERPIRIEVVTIGPPHAVTGSDLARSLEAAGILPEERMVYTRSDGTFELENLPAGWVGSLMLPTTHVILEPTTGASGLMSKRFLRVAAGDSPIVLRTVKHPCVIGRLVWSDDGSPCKARLLLSYRGGDDSDTSLPGSFATLATTDADGVLEFGIPVDPSLLGAGLDARVRGIVHTEVELRISSSERAALAMDRTLVSLEGGTFPIDLGTILVTPAPTVAVRVTGPEGGSVAGAIVVSAAGSARTGTDGCATIAVEDVDQLTVLAAGYGLAEFPVPQVKGSFTPAELRLTPGHALAVRVADPVTMRTQGLTLQLAWERSPFEGAIVGEASGNRPFPWHAHGAFHDGAILWPMLGTGPDGLSGRMSLRSRGGEDLLVPGLVAGSALSVRIVNELDQALAEVPVRVPDAPGIQVVEIAPPSLSSDGLGSDRQLARLNLLLVDRLGHPIPGASVSLKHDFDHDSRSFDGENGHLDVGPLLAGIYQARLSAPGYVSILIESMRLAAEDGERVFTLEKSRPLEVVVVDELGRDVRAQWVELSAEGWTEREESPRRGRASFESTPRGFIDVEARVGTRVYSGRVDEKTERAELVVPAQGRVLFRLQQPPLGLTGGGRVQFTVQEANTAGSDRAKAEPLVLKARYGHVGSFPVDVGADLAPGVYDVSIEGTEDRQDAPGIVVAQEGFVITAQVETRVELPK